VIDLTRLPSQGRDLGLLLRKTAALRRVPLVFAGGAAEKVRVVRRLLPDATFTTWERIERALPRAIAHPPASPVVPASVFAAYAGRPLAQKLGIKSGMRIALVAAPPDFAVSLGSLPDGASIAKGLKGRPHLILWFVRSSAELSGAFERVLARSGDALLWILWPKKASGVSTDLTQVVVRAAGLRAGLVDYKICSVDATWSALLFKRR
jgi:hypothetical protein